MELKDRMRPKGFNCKVWDVLYKEAEGDKKWALEIIQLDTRFANTASASSIKWLGQCLYMSEWQLAKEAY